MSSARLFQPLQETKEPLINLNPTKIMENRATLVNSGKLIDLDFEAKDFVQSIYTAYEQKLINENQWATTIALFSFVKINKDKTRKPFHQFTFGEGPYNPATLTYATKENLEVLTTKAAQLQKSSPSENVYFCINLSRKREITFLYDMLEDRNYLNNPSYLIFLEKYVRSSSYSYQKVIFREIDRLRLQDPRHEEYAKSLQKFILSQEPTLIDWLEKKGKKIKNYAENFKITDMILTEEERERSDALFFSALVERNQHIPHLILSPDFEEKQKGKPIISLVLPSMALFKEFLVAMHGEKHATFPYFVSRPFTTREIREVDENPSKHGLPIQSRPVQLLAANEELGYVEAHGFLTHHSTLFIHDLFHCLQNSQNIYKPFARYIRTVLEKAQGFDMTLGIWEASDMDYTGYEPGSPTLIREIQAKKQCSINVEISFLIVILFRSIDFSPDAMSHGEASILMADSIINRDKWQEFLDPLNITPEKLWAPSLDLLPSMFENVTGQTFEANSRHFKIMSDLIKEFPGKSHSSYLLGFWFIKIGRHNLVSSLMKCDLDSILVFIKNKGLHLKSSVCFAHFIKGPLLISELFTIKPSSRFCGMDMDKERAISLICDYFNIPTQRLFISDWKRGEEGETTEKVKALRRLILSAPSQDDPLELRQAYQQLLLELKPLGIDDNYLQRYLQNSQSNDQQVKEMFHFVPPLTHPTFWQPNKKNDIFTFKKALFWIQNNYYLEALFELSMLIALDKSAADAHYIRCAIRLDLLDIQGAELDFKKSLDTKSESFKLRLPWLEKRLKKEKLNVKPCDITKIDQPQCGERKEIKMKS